MLIIYYGEDSVDVPRAIRVFKYNAEYSPQNNNVWKWKAERLEYLASKPDNSVEYYVVKNKYSIINPLVKAEQTLTRYYLISSDNKILLQKDNENFDVDDKGKTRSFRYEVALAIQDLGVF